MASIETFEEIEAWKKGRELARSIYQLTASTDISRDFALRDQLRRAAVSVVSNIAEGFERNGDREFKHFLAMAKGSTGEIRAQLYIALDASLIPLNMFEHAFTLAGETGRLIGGFMKYLDQSK
jgi:four helix bundle protein